MRALTVAAVAALLQPSLAGALSVGSVVPDVRIAPAAEGAPLDRDAFTGGPTVVNFWATWCAACKTELHELVAAFPREDGAPRLVLVSLDKDPATAQEWLRANLGSAATAVSFSDPDFKAAEAYGVDAFPMTFVIDREGKVQAVHRGFEPGRGSTEALAKKARALTAR